MTSKFQIQQLLTFFFFLSSLVSHAQKTYYLDSESGDDKNSGLTPETCWATLSKVNSIKFQPGEKLLIKAGSLYVGQFAPKGSGTPGMPIEVNMYGEGNKPRIDGRGDQLSTILLQNIEYWEISNLEITNTGPQRAARRTGISIIAKDFGNCRHIYLRDLSIHDVNGSLIKKEGGGSAIYWENGGDSIRTRFSDLRIEACHLYNCERNGIVSDGYVTRDNWYPSVGVVIRKNLLEKIPGDGIVPIGCDSALIEHNIMKDSPDILSETEAAAGIWPWSSDNTVIQFNEVSGHKAKWDGQGFDSDWNCKNTLIQYNYSHDNNGGFLLICNYGGNINTKFNHGTTGTIVRYNVSVNDGLRPYPTASAGYFSPVFHISGPCENTQIYNNIIFVKPKPSAQIDRTIVKMDNWGGPWPVNTVFKNNIFYALDSCKFAFGNDKGTSFSSNVYYGPFKSLPIDNNAIFSDPLFKCIPQHHDGFEVLKCFQLMNSSPCINSGTEIDALGIKDFFGRLLNNGKVDRGIYEASSLK